ncbi:MAG: response regulator receiver protein [Micrococcaceae bacterium]|nr:response regulator receiver protein [Micrococcaceae bacterium]
MTNAHNPAHHSADDGAQISAQVGVDGDAVDSVGAVPELHLLEVLQNLVLDSGVVRDFLTRLAVVAVKRLSGPGREVLCSVTLVRPRTATTVAGSSPRAKVMDEIQYVFGDGPCLDAARTYETNYVRDVRQEDHRWPEYRAAIAHHGLLSILAVPVRLDGDTRAAINLYHSTGCFHRWGDSGRSVLRGPSLLSPAPGGSDRFSLRYQRQPENRPALPDSHRPGRRHHHGPEPVLTGHSDENPQISFSARNIKLRDVAAAVVSAVADGVTHTHFDQ